MLLLRARFLRVPPKWGGPPTRPASAVKQSAKWRYDLVLTRKTVFLFCLALALLGAQTASRFVLTVDSIMRGPNLAGFAPARARWSGDGERIYFQWKQASDRYDAPLDTYVVNRDGSALRKLTEEEARLAPPAAGDMSQDKRLTVYARNGDLYVYESASGKTRQITKTADTESNPRFLRDGKRIGFVRSNNLYVLSLEDGALVQMTEIAAAGAAAPAGRGGRGGAADSEKRGTDSQEYLKKEQKDLLESIRQRAARREEDEARRKRENPRKPFSLQARQSVDSLQLSPDEKFVTAVITERPETAKDTLIPSFVTESGYAEDAPGRSNVGDTQPTARLAIIDAATGEVKWVDHGIRAAAPAQPTAPATSGPPAPNPQPQDRQVRLTQPVWSADGSKAVLLGRAADNKDEWVFALDAAAAKLRVLADNHDDAWVDDSDDDQVLGWMKNGREVYFRAERPGYWHLYAVPFDGDQPRALTSGDWEVLDVRQSRDKSKFYLVANKETPFEQHVYVMDGEGGPLTRLTEAPGKHSIALSPDERWFADIYSASNKPPELYVQQNRALAAGRKLTESPAPEFRQYAWQDPPIVMVPARDGVKVPARLYKPANFRAGGPAVIFIHGAGYLQNVHRWWAEYYREYMFNHLLMERGFLVIDVDYRGSAGYGRNWRTAVYQHMGGKDLDDLVDAAKFVVSQYGVDAREIGMYGGSYGGFLTLMGMFTQPDVFAAGAALRPVTDWAYYNHEYTSDILNLPQSDSEAYRKSSPIYYAQGLKGALLICHGMVDTNVEFQDTVRLTQRLIELRKENWSVAAYPVENHTFVDPASWADEYKRILKLFEENLK
jgi:dipeptidyl aminopeptidase/acylaminoacyl peptidase